MAMVYDNLKGSFKEGKATDESKNQSGLMAKELSALSSAGPKGHTLAYITPEEEKILQKATVFVLFLGVCCCFVGSDCGIVVNNV